MFKNFKTTLQQHVSLLLTGQTTLFVSNVPNDTLYENYLAAFPEEVRQEYTCNCCRQFVKHYGGLVVIQNNTIRSIWEVQTEGYYQQVADAMHKLVAGNGIRDVFVSDTNKLGTDSNVQQLEDGTTTRWEHMYLLLPPIFKTSASSLDAVRGEKRTTVQMFQRALEELSISATQTILELIAQNSLYRGVESKAVLEAFLVLQQQYALLSLDQKSVFVWSEASKPAAMGAARIRNTAMGTLLIDLSENVELDVAVTKFERVMAPSNYKRPNTLFTKKMLEDAQLKLEELGLTSALQRRFAVPEDITVNNVFFMDRKVTNQAQDIFGQLAGSIAVNPKSLSKVETISFADFISKVVPTAQSIELLLENKQVPNLVSLIAPSDPQAGNLFKWDNNFSWSYNNALADSMKERVKAAGGNVEGVLRFSIQWNEDGKDILDFDAHAHEPMGSHIYYGSHHRGNVRTSASGSLDVDMINPSGVGVENITWTDKRKMKPGEYRLRIHNFNSGNNKGFSAEVEFDGVIHHFSTTKKVLGYLDVATVKLDKNGNFSISSTLDSNSGVKSQKVWNLDTQQFQKVSSLMFSPNYWDNQQTGNQHVFFMLEQAKNEGVVRGFFNEFLRPTLDVHRKVFEALASKMQVAPATVQLSGVGFSLTQPTEFIVKVTGTFARTLKVTI